MTDRQLTSREFTSVLKQRGIKSSIDGKGRWRDNVFVERLWKWVKYEEVYLHAYDCVQILLLISTAAPAKRWLVELHAQFCR